jgi:AraC-like DNA-binding protein
MAQVGSEDLNHWLEVARRLDYNADRLSKELQISRRQLERSTHKHLGKTPQNWLNGERLIAALGMMKPHCRVKIIAYQLGFKQPSHFSREFKHYYGVSPKSLLAIGKASAPLVDKNVNTISMISTSPAVVEVVSKCR